METAAILAILSLALTSAAGLRFLHLIRRVRVGQGRPLVLMMAAGALALGVTATTQGAAGAAQVAAATGITGGACFLLLVALGRQSRKTPAVRVGSAILPITAPDADGHPFDLASMSGRPFLLKFFRGHW
ncbi:MAG TPA: hypothetical protein VEL28_21185 [Candidatus Binatia bacterium]|nr:hypothetical protein [Candidatus Binatia bacterium]